MFVKFNTSGNAIAFFDGNSLDEMIDKTDAANFEPIPNGMELCRFFLRKINGVISIDTVMRDAALNAEIESQKKSLRNRYMDAYRKYQAAVNYGEFQRVPAVDFFIRSLRNKDWTVLNNIPTALKYFAGECSFAQSGLVENPV